MSAAFLQVLMAVTGLVAIYMATSLDPAMRRWAAVFGLLGQPAWLYVTWQHGEFGMFVVSVAYSVIWLRAGWREWHA